MPDIASTRMHLEWRGLLSASAFDLALTKPRGRLCRASRLGPEAKTHASLLASE